MDLIYMNADKEDIGVMHDYTFDLAFGNDENDFECKIVGNNHCCSAGFFLYYEGAEYGGIIDSIKVDTNRDELTYSGRTWHGILNSKVIEPLKETDEGTSEVVVHKGGKNLLHNTASTTTIGGITFTINEDGSVTLNGTSTGASLIIEKTSPVPKGDLILSISDVSVGAFLLAGYFKEDGTIVNEVKRTYNSTTLAFPDEAVTMRVYIGVPSGNTMDNVTVYPMIRCATDTSDLYKPYKSLVDEYLMISGEANNVMQWLIERMGVSDLFRASTEKSGIDIVGYKMNRYILGYDGIRKMLKAFDAKLNISFKDGFVALSAEPFVDYSKDEQFDTDQIDFVVKKNSNPINHVICLGKGDLAEREVIHVYADSNGNIGTTQSLTGIQEVSAVYDNSNAESSEELQQGGIDMILESWASDEISFSFSTNDETYDIGDIVGAKEKVTGIEVNAEVTKKIVKISNNTTTISYKVGE